MPTLYLRNLLNSTNLRILLNFTKIKYPLMFNKNLKYPLNPKNRSQILYHLKPSKSLSLLYKNIRKTNILLQKGYLKNPNPNLILIRNLTLSKKLYKKL